MKKCFLMLFAFLFSFSVGAAITQAQKNEIKSILDSNASPQDKSGELFDIATRLIISSHDV